MTELIKMNATFSIFHQANVLKTIRYLQHSKYASSGTKSLSQAAPKEAWTSKVPSSLTSRSSTLSLRSSNSATPIRDGMNKSKYLGFTCVRHVIQHCGGYLLDSLAPPVSPTLGKTTLMVLREAVVNGEVRLHSRHSSLMGWIRSLGMMQFLYSQELQWKPVCKNLSGIRTCWQNVAFFNTQKYKILISQDKAGSNYTLVTVKLW